MGVDVNPAYLEVARREAGSAPVELIVAAFDDTTQQGAVYRLWLDGRRAIVARGAWDPRGVTTDGRRVLIACHRAGRVLIVPLV